MSDEHSLKRRLQVAYWGIPLLIACTLVGGVVFMALILLAHGLIMFEFHRLAESKNLPGNPIIAVILGSLLIITLYFQWWWGLPMLGAILLLTETFRKDFEPFERLGLLSMGWLYISLFLGCLVLIRQFGGPRYFDGAAWLILLLTTIWVCDTAAYWGGSVHGKTPLHTNASPNKTVEGFAFGAAAAMLWALIWTQLPWIHYSVSDGIAMGIIVGGFGQAGDLVESMFKRAVDVKDTSDFLGGHGGVLDRFDSLLFSAPVLLAYILLSNTWL